jgi:hypothetical protein
MREAYPTKPFVSFVPSFKNCGWGEEMRLQNRHPRMF